MQTEKSRLALAIKRAEELVQEAEDTLDGYEFSDNETVSQAAGEAAFAFRNVLAGLENALSTLSPRRR